MIAVEKHKSSIIINNKGELLFPKGEFGKRSETRNRLLSDLLLRAIYMERAGTGIKRIKDTCMTNHNKVSFSFSDAFWITFKSNTSDKVPDNLTEYQKKIMKLIEVNKQISMSKMSKSVGISKRKILDNIIKLKDKNLIRRIGKPKTGHWEII